MPSFCRLAILAALAALAACTDEPPTAPDPLVHDSIVREWSFSTTSRQQRNLGWTTLGELRRRVGGSVFEEVVFGQEALTNDDARGEVYSSESGLTYWALAEAPWAGPSDSTAPLGARTYLTQYQRFRKVAPDATLQYVVTDLFLELADGNGPAITEQQCPWWVPDEEPRCTRAMHAWVNLAIGAWRTPMAIGCEEPDSTCLVEAGGSLDLYGWAGHWAFATGASRWGEAFWSDDDFTFRTSGGALSSAELTLARPIVVDVPLGRLAIGDTFTTTTFLFVNAINHRQGESSALAYLRDPAGATGLGLSYRGVEPVSAPAGAPRFPEPGPVAECSGGGGTIQFASPEFEEPEWPTGRAPIVVTRTGDATSAASVRISTAGGSAQAGSDYEPLATYVRWAAGQSGHREVDLVIRGDADEEPRETIGLMLSDPRCGVLGPQSTATFTILDDDGVTAGPLYAVGGTVSGLEGSGLVLYNYGAQLPIAADGPFQFVTRYSSGLPYQVTVHTQPAAPLQVCTVVNGSGLIAAMDVTDVAVTCDASPGNGALDRGFGADGKITTGLPGGASAAALQDDGRIVLVGGNRVARYHPDGTPDHEFGVAGIVTVNFYGSHDVLNAVAVQPDGRIVVAGYSKDGVNSAVQEDFILARLENDGTPDMSFGSGGKVVTDFHGRGDGAWDVVLQPDGAIVVAGQISRNDGGISDSDFAVARYTSTGALDASFGLGGFAAADIAGGADLGQAVAVQPDGRILVAGRVAKSGGDDPDVAIVRFLPNGALDSTFGEAGVMRERTDGAGDEAADMVLQPDGRIVIAGQLNAAGAVSVLVARYHADGQPDTGFGTAGRLITPLFTTARTLARDPDGRIVVAGMQLGFPSSDFAVTRLTPEGAIDEAFGEAGLVTVDFFGGGDDARATLIQPDGRIILAGSARNGATTGLGLTRILP